MRATLAPFFPVLLAACAASEGVRWSDDAFPDGDPFQHTGWYVRRLVDDLTGQPIAGAQVFLVTESRTPIAGEFWYSAKGTSDGEGFVRIPMAAVSRLDMQVVRDARCAVTTQSGDQNAIWRIGRACDVPVRVEDWNGRPVAGALIGFCGGCGHTPDLVNARTDADGIAVLRGIDPHNHIGDVYVHHPGVGLGYDSIGWRPGEPPDVVRCTYSPPKCGCVIDHRGEPVADAFVGALDVHRGPWAQTAADGTFTVLGAPFETDVHIVVTPSGREVHFAVRNGYPATLQLPDLADEDATHGAVLASDSRPLAPMAPREVDETDAAEVLVAGRVVEANGAPVAASARWRARWSDSYPEDERAFVSCADGRFELPCDRAGHMLLELVPASADRGLLPRMLWVMVPRRGDTARLDVGDVVLRTAPQLRVLGAHADWQVGFARAGWQDAGVSFVWPLAADGAWRGPDLRDGDTIVIEHDGERVPFRSVLRGDGPWVFEPPDGALELTVVDGVGETVRAQLVLGDFECSIVDGQMLRGLRPGPHRLWLSAPGHRTAIVDTVVGEQPKLLRVVLPKR